MWPIRSTFLLGTVTKTSLWPRAPITGSTTYTQETGKESYGLKCEKLLHITPQKKHQHARENANYTTLCPLIYSYIAADHQVEEATKSMYNNPYLCLPTLVTFYTFVLRGIATPWRYLGDELSSILSYLTTWLIEEVEGVKGVERGRSTRLPVSYMTATL